MARSTKLERQEQALEAIYRRAEEKLRKVLAEDLEKGNLGSARYRRKRLDSVRQILSDLQDEAVPAATQLTTAAYIEGATAAALATGNPVPDFGSGQNRQALELLADNLSEGLNGAAEQVGRRIEDVYRRVGLEAASQQLAQGNTLRDATRELLELLQQQGLSAGPGGARNWSLSRYAEMVIRTNTTQAVTRGNINVAVADGFDLVEVLVIGDELLCDECSPYADKVFTLGDREGYETLEEYPPFHPNCRCDLNILTEDPNG